MPIKTGMEVQFIDGCRSATQKSDPAYPNGKPVSLADVGTPYTCCFNLPYPAPRCGLYEVKCMACGFVGAITVAGRADDPNMVTIPCRRKT